MIDLNFKKNKNNLMSKIMTVVFHIFFAFVVFFIQTSIFPMIPIFSNSPNLLIILTFSYAIFYGENIGILTGLICGFLSDMYFSGLFGFYVLIYSLMGFFNGKIKKEFFDDTLEIPMVLSIVNTLIYNIYVYLFNFLVRSRFDFFGYLIKIIFPNVFFTLICTIIVYKILYHFNLVKR